MRVAFLGDTHANTQATYQVIDKVAELGVDTIIQCGDFGFWPRLPLGQKFLRKISHRLVNNGIILHWADGNHEDHSRLPHHQTEPWEHDANIIWHPRGTVSEMGGKKVLWMGGAVSVDKYYRTPGYDWFANEIPSQEEWDRGLTAGKVDIMVSHDAPQGIVLKSTMRVREELIRASDHMRFGLSSVMEATRPRLVAHGHWHHRMTTLIGEVLVLSLGCDHDPLRERGLVLDLEALDTEPRMASATYFE